MALDGNTELTLTLGTIGGLGAFVWKIARRVGEMEKSFHEMEKDLQEKANRENVQIKFDALQDQIKDLKSGQDRIESQLLQIRDALEHRVASLK